MKRAWLCYTREFEWDDESSIDVEIKFEEPSAYKYWKIIPIVFTEVEDYKIEKPEDDW